jgi:hypothetical protein
MLKVKDIDLKEGGIRIDGKRNKKNQPKIRFFPFKVLPEVGEICKSLIYKTDEQGNKVLRDSNEKLFTWNNSQSPGTKSKCNLLFFNKLHFLMSKSV